MTGPPIFKIHPSIGIARVGDAATFFIGPETPGLRPTGEAPGTTVPPYKDGGKIKRQAARFRVYEYVDKGGQYTLSREVSLAEKDVTMLVWTVHLANRKASFFRFNGLAGNDRPNPRGRRNDRFAGDRRNLEIDPGERWIAGKNAKPVPFTRGTSANPARELWPNPKPAPEITTLGELRTDADGRLLVLGGSGLAASMPGAAAIADYANNDGWFDDVSDGPVMARLAIKGKEVRVVPAWVLCGPPDFAPHLANVVSLYDMLYDLAARELVLPTNEAAYSGGALKGLAAVNAEFKRAGKAELSSYQPDFATEIFPLLYRAIATMFLFEPALHAHRATFKWQLLASRDARDKPHRDLILNALRKPDTPPGQPLPYMPKLLGDEPYPLPGGVIHQRVRLTVTPTQYALLEQWAKGNFVPPAVVPPAPPSGPNITPEGLDRAALENAVGGAFFPGIEAGWQMRMAAIYAEPFRVKIGAPSPYLGEVGGVVRSGHFSRQMALPWHADFLRCKAESDATRVFAALAPGWGWWPAQRPDIVFASEADFRASPPKTVPWHRATRGGAKVTWPTGSPGEPDVPSYQEMLDNWRKFGFIVEKSTNVFVEDEREPDIP